jgi:hypothetical protein
MQPDKTEKLCNWQPSKYICHARFHHSNHLDVVELLSGALLDRIASEYLPTESPL